MHELHDLDYDNHDYEQIGSPSGIDIIEIYMFDHLINVFYFLLRKKTYTIMMEIILK